MRQSIRNLHPYVSLLLLLFLHVAAQGGDIRGQVHFASPAQEEEISIPRYTTRPAPKMGMTASHSVRAVVYIADAFPDSNFAIPRVNPILDQRNEQFVPYILPVLVGSGVTKDNVAAILARTDGVIVASSLKRDGVWWNPVDTDRVKALMRAAQS